MKNENSLPEYLKTHAAKERASFHMPGHKGQAFFERLGYGDAVNNAADFDVTEIPGADDLRKSDGVIKAIADKYQELYESRRSFISVNGSSALIMAAIRTCVRPGRKIIAAADSHISVFNGIKLADAETVLVEPESLDIYGNGGAGGGSYLDAPGTVADAAQTVTDAAQIVADAAQSTTNAADAAADSLVIPGGISAADIAEALDKNQDADAVILPSPNYFGVTSDISAISEEIHKREKILIVDQAHGAHLKMLRGQRGQSPLTPRYQKGLSPLVPAEDCGADTVIDSTHKTMASFTQTAVANLFGGMVDPAEYEQNLLMLESTSPSYVLMNSLAVNADIMERHGSELAEEWIKDLDYFYDKVKDIKGIRVLTREKVRAASAASDFDESKIVIDFGGVGMTGEQAEEALIERGIYPEFHVGNVVMFLTGIGNVRADYEILIDALNDMLRNCTEK